MSGWIQATMQQNNIINNGYAGISSTWFSGFVR